MDSQFSEVRKSKSSSESDSLLNEDQIVNDFMTTVPLPKNKVKRKPAFKTLSKKGSAKLQSKVAEKNKKQEKTKTQAAD